VHQPQPGSEGAIALQWSQRDSGAVGEEAFVPGSESRDIGAFWIGNRKFGPLGLQLGVRHDRNRIDVDEALAIGPDRGFDTTSGSLSLEWEASDDLHLALGLDRAQRSPTAEELYSNGVHVATGSVEHGNPALEPEIANRVEVGAHWHLGPVTLRAAVYRVGYDDFIYLARTGDSEEGLPVQQWRQADARFTGGEGELEWALADNASGQWDLRLFGDVVRAKLVDGGNLPRIAPARVGSELRWERGALRASLGAVRYMEQDRVAAFETPTPGYTVVDAHFAWHGDTQAGNAWELFVDGRNLLDEEARPHTSFLKDVAPLPGRGIETGVRVFF
jgi:iron complex outermembrane receptor protein